MFNCNGFGVFASTRLGRIAWPGAVGRELVSLIVVGWIACLPAAAADQATDFDVLFRRGTVIDGSGQPRFQADVGVRHGRVAAIGDLANKSGQQVFDIQDKILCPGFVDLHSHADRGILEFRLAENYIRQGVTTLLCGNCGSSPVDVAEFFAKLRRGGTGPNIALLIGHGSVRGAVIGPENKAPSAQQLGEMQRLVRQALDAGAVGMSTSLRYGLGAYANTDEIVALARQIGPYGGFYATHMRDEGTRIIEALEEALLIGREAGIPVHVSHHKISSASVFGLTRQTLARIDQVRQAGFDVTLDQYPYGAGSGGTTLYVPQSSLSGGIAEFRKRIADPRQRRRILEAVEELFVRKLYLADQSPSDPDHTRQALARIQIARAPHERQWEGKNLTQILEQRGEPITSASAAELMLELVSHGVGGINHTLEDRPGGDVDRVMLHPQTCIASDGGVPKFGEGNPHPRSYGCYPRLLGRYVRERQLLSLEQAIHKMTQLPARRLGWTQRGSLRTGYWADLVVFDPDAVADKATFIDPHQYSVGVEHVVVRGEFVLRGGQMTGAHPGRPLASVPVADSPLTQLRRDLLEMLQAYDGRFALSVIRDGEQVDIAINQDAKFDMAGLPDLGITVKPADAGQSVVALSHELAKSNETRLRLSGAHGSFVLFQRLSYGKNKPIVVTLVYTGLSDVESQRVAAELPKKLITRLRKRNSP